MKSGLLSKIGVSFLLIAIVIYFSSCNASNEAKGGAIGAVVGGAVGAVIGEHYDNPALGAIIGAGVGGGTGLVIGKQMDKQAEEMDEDLENASVERVGEGIMVTFDSGLMFDVNSANLKAESEANLAELAEILNKYPDTDILIEGHTDSSGSEEYNQKLSEERAASVKAMLAERGVDGARITMMGLGETVPVADNETDEGRQKNRRVELAITANEDMVKAAENGELGE